MPVIVWEDVKIAVTMVVEAPVILHVLVAVVMDAQEIVKVIAMVLVKELVDLDVQESVLAATCL